MTNAASLDTVIARQAGRQFGVVTRAQLAESGVSRHSLRRRVETGRLVHVGRHVYAVPGAPDSWQRSALAACLDLGPTALLSHWSAARLWELGEPLPSAIDVTVPYGNCPRPGPFRVVVHRSRSIGADDRTVYRRLPVTTVERTLLDLAAVAEPPILATCADNALCRRLMSPAGLQATLERVGTPGRKGVEYLRRVLSPWLAGNEVESVAEGQVRRAIAGAGLPAPVTRHEVHTPEGRFVGRLDFAWPDRHVALEVDGFRWHANPKAQVEDAARANRLAALGWTVLRTTPAEVAAGGADLIAALRRHLGQV